MSIRKMLIRLARDIGATSSVEYGLICAFIILAMMAAMSTMASGVQSTWNNVSSQSASAMSQANASS